MRQLFSHKLSWIVILLVFHFLLACKNTKSPSPTPASSGKTEGLGSGPEASEEEELPDIEGLPKPKPGPQSSDGAGLPQTQPNPPNPGPAASLPANFVEAIDACKAQNRYYDLAQATCTTTSLANFACDLMVLLSEGSAVLNSTQKTKLKEYIDANLVGYSLYACTSEAAGPKLHFYKVETDRIRAHTVSITP
jgi:hypothetical protein